MKRQQRNRPLTMASCRRLMLILSAIATCCSALITNNSPSVHLIRRSSSAASSSSFARNQRVIAQLRESSISSSIEDDKAVATPTTTTADSNLPDLQATITSYLNEATNANAQSQNNNDVVTKQRHAIEHAERILNQWIELSKGGTEVIPPPSADVFNSIIQGYLSLPSSIISEEQNINNEEEECISDNNNCEEEELSEKDQIRSILGKKKVVINNNKGGGMEQKSLNIESATRILDLMESYYEPTPEIYDMVIDSHGKLALEYLAKLSAPTDDDEQSKQHSLYYSLAWKSAKAALQLLNRSEDLYIETGQQPDRLPGISSYATVMDVYKALAVNSAELILDSSSSIKKSRDEALNVWKSLRQRRSEIFRLIDDLDADADDMGGSSNARGGSKFNILPREVTVTGSVEDTFYYAYNMLRENSPSYTEEESSEQLMNVDKIGTYHFNQLIFDLAKYPQSFSGLLAQDLLEFMMLMVNKGSNTKEQSVVPKPNVDTVNGVLKAWMVTPNYGADAIARRVESVLAKLAGWQSDGTLWNVTPDTVSYNTCINCWKQSGVPGAAGRATEILALMEDESTNVKPDAISYCTCIAAWAQCASTNAKAGANAEAILTRMHSRGIENEDAPKPTTRYNIVLDAFSRRGDAESAERLLADMYDRSKRGSITKPNAHSYTAVLTAWARNEDDKVVATKQAEDLFNSLERKYAAGVTDVRADTSVYNALINVWTKQGDRKALYRVTQLLELMEELGLQGGDDIVAPNSRTYCAVLDCLARSRNFKAYNKSLEIIQRMEDFYAEGYEAVRPCVRAYSTVITTIARSRKRNKAVKAQEMLRRMESQYVKGNVAARPNVFSYNGVLNAAAFTNGDEKDQEEAFRVACLTFDELRMSEHLQPSHVSYGTFLKAIRNLMPESEMREKLVTSVFRRCCKEGLVGDMVLREMKAISSPDFYQSLMEGVGYGTKLGIPPKSFSSNVVERDHEWRS
ncbi:hypothetical protein ACHAWC_005357 [Mediolabrus comicus]